jgi:hypothetical protein
MRHIANGFEHHDRRARAPVRLSAHAHLSPHKRGLLSLVRIDGERHPALDASRAVVAVTRLLENFKARARSATVKDGPWRSCVKVCFTRLLQKLGLGPPRAKKRHTRFGTRYLRGQCQLILEADHPCTFDTRSVSLRARLATIRSSQTSIPARLAPEVTRQGCRAKPVTCPGHRSPETVRCGYRFRHPVMSHAAWRNAAFGCSCRKSRSVETSCRA